MQQVVLVTGATSGLGSAIATLLSNKNFRIFGTSRNPSAAPKLGFPVIELDIRNSASIANCVSKVIEEAQRLDILVNNAGVPGPIGASEEVPLSQLKKLFETNFFGLVEMTNAVLPIMRNQKGGTIINVSSASAIVANGLASGYAASKYALEGFTESLRYEVAPHNVKVSMVQPSLYRTNILNNIEQPERPLAAYPFSRKAPDLMSLIMSKHGREPLEVAEAVLRIIEATEPNLRYPVGKEAKMLSLAKRLLPYAAVEKMVRKMQPLE